MASCPRSGLGSRCWRPARSSRWCSRSAPEPRRRPTSPQRPTPPPRPTPPKPPTLRQAPDARVGSPPPMATTSTSEGGTPRPRVPAAERRGALIDAAVHEFARGGLYGTPVDRIARRVGVAQPYVFSLFGTKRELFLAAVERGFELTAETFTTAAAEYDPAVALPDADILL